MNEIKNKRHSYKSNKNNNTSSDNDDIIQQLSQLTSNDDKSFESSLITKNIPILYDINNYYSKGINNNLSERNKNLNSIKNLKKNSEEENLLINNKYFPLNQKLKYLCSLIQIFNINIKKYDDLQQFSRYFTNDIIKSNQLEPINILFDIISELIFYIQRETKNNSILMKEIKTIKQKRKEQENLINKINVQIQEKEKELEDIKTIKNKKFYEYTIKEKEINDLKKENQELANKINTYKNQIKKFRFNNIPFLTQLESNNSKKENFNYSLFNDLNNSKNIYNLYTLNNSYDNSLANLNKRNKSIENNVNNFYLTRDSKRNNNNFINFNKNFSPLKTLNNEKMTKSRRNYNNENNNNDKNINGSIIINLKMLLKEINDMLCIYNSHLEKINLNNNINGNNNIKEIYSFVNEMSDKMNKLKNFTELNDDKNDVIYKKSIQVNTSRWKFRKKSNNKNKFRKINENINLNIKRKNTSSSVKKDLIFNNLLN